jgi:MraZ protein
MFRGRYQHTIDAKGRTSVPARYRAALDTSGERHIVLTCALDPCLMAYTSTEWAKFEERLVKASPFDRFVQKMKRIYLSGAVECEIDDVGRILIPPSLRDHARLKKEALWAGVGEYAELWDKDEWTKHIETTDEERDAMATHLSGLRL